MPSSMPFQSTHPHHMWLTPSFHGCAPLSMPCLHHRPCLMCPPTFVHSCAHLHHGLHLCPLTCTLVHTLCFLHHLSMAVCPDPQPATLSTYPHPCPCLVLSTPSVHGCTCLCQAM